MKYSYAIFPVTKNIDANSWQHLIKVISKLQKPLSSWRIIISYRKMKIHFYLESNFAMPASLHDVPDFLFQAVALPKIDSHTTRKIYFQDQYNFVDLKSIFKIHKNLEITTFELEFFTFYHEQMRTKIFAHGKDKSYQLLFHDAQKLLTVDFAKHPELVYKSPPKYLDTYKILSKLKSESNNATFTVDTFPYAQNQLFLDQAETDFNKHSLVLGASGSGKSKFLSLMVENIIKNSKMNQNYKFIIIDPHAALEQEIGGLGKIINFLNDAHSANLFAGHTRNISVSVELLLDIFKGLIANNYNSKLERVLRHSICLLLTIDQFNFHNLRQLLLDLDFRNQLLRNSENVLPASVLTFFYSEFSEIKTHSYTEAISPIVALIDEVEMIPIFSQESKSDRINELIQSNILTIFSLDRTKFGDRVVKIVAGLIMQQILTLAEQHAFNEHLLFIVDEVAVVENPILCRFLSEARKYNLSIILAGQYFGGISAELRQTFFANTPNYYIFRIAKDDANIITQNLDMKIPLDNSLEQKIKTLIGLQNRECIIRISAGEKLIPAFKAQTLDFVPKPYIQQNQSEKVGTKVAVEKMTIDFQPTTVLSLREILSINTSKEQDQTETSIEFIKRKN